MTYSKAGAYTSTWSSSGYSGKVLQAAGTTRTVEGTRPAILDQDWYHEVRVGQTISADGSWSPGAKLSYRWTCDGKLIKGATKRTYRVPASRFDCQLRVKVTGKAGGAKSLTRTSAPVHVGPASFLVSGQPRISGTAKAGSTLRVVRPGYSPAPARFTYQWYRNGTAIKGATKSSYKLTSASVGKTITVRVRAHRAGHSRSTIYSAPSAGVTR